MCNRNCNNTNTTNFDSNSIYNFGTDEDYGCGRRRGRCGSSDNQPIVTSGDVLATGNVFATGND